MSTEAHALTRDTKLLVTDAMIRALDAGGDTELMITLVRIVKNLDSLMHQHDMLHAQHTKLRVELEVYNQRKFSMC